jgi:hypothetical protein
MYIRGSVLCGTPLIPRLLKVYIGQACPGMKKHWGQCLQDCLWTSSDVNGSPKADSSGVTGSLDFGVFSCLGILIAALVNSCALKFSVPFANLCSLLFKMLDNSDSRWCVQKGWLAMATSHQRSTILLVWTAKLFQATEKTRFRQICITGDQIKLFSVYIKYFLVADFKKSNDFWNYHDRMNICTSLKLLLGGRYFQSIHFFQINILYWPLKKLLWCHFKLFLKAETNCIILTFR